MGARRVALLIGAIALLCSLAFGQATGTLTGTVLDPGGAAVPNVKVEIKNLTTGAVRETISGPEGIFVFNSVTPARYDLTITATAGFKTYSSKDIAVTAAEKRDLGNISLALGSLTEEVSVTAAATPIQTASSEKSQLIEASQMANITTKGRDLFAILQTIPGISFGNALLTNQGDATSNASGTFGNMEINGGGRARSNFSVDGVIAMDNGNNSQLMFEPTTDSIAEIRVLTSNYQAEYGHSSSGQISVITKGGSQDFHGSLNVNKRHEMWNAHTFAQNYSGQSDKTKYRYFISTYTVGGPVYIPKLFNASKRKLFFFWSQEYTKQKPNSNPRAMAQVPTQDQLNGIFNDRCTITGATLDKYGVPVGPCAGAYTTGNGTAATIASNWLINPIDQTRNTPLTSGNLNDLVGLSVGGKDIYNAQSAAIGQAFLKDMPLPNMCTAAAGRYNGASISPTNCPSGFRTDLPYDLSSNLGWQYSNNYVYSCTQPHPHRNDTLRLDWNIPSRLNSYVRWTRDTDWSNQNYNLPIKNGAGAYDPFSLIFALPGHGYAVGTTYTLSPTTVNEFTFGKIWGAVGWYAKDESQLLASSITKTPLPNFYDLTKDANVTSPGNFGKRWAMTDQGYRNWGPYVPTLGFGARNGRGEASPNSGCGWGVCPYTNWAESWTFSDSISKVQGKHNLKFGVYVEKTAKDQQGRTGNYNGNWSFSDSSDMPMSTGDGYANAWLGNFRTYSQGYGNFSEWWFWQTEFYAQDSWRVNRRLTLDLGVRFYMMPPITNTSTGLNSSSEFVPQLYKQANQLRIYEPGCAILDASGNPTGAFYNTSTRSCPNDGRPNGTRTMAWDRATGKFAGVWLQNTFVPVSVGGYSVANPVTEAAMTQCGSDPLLPKGCYNSPSISPAFRFGFAWDVFGNGKTAIRGGVGQFLNRLSYNQIAGANSYSLPLSKTTYYGSIMDVTSPTVQASASQSPRGTIGVGFNGFQQNEATYNGSFGIQQSVGFSTVLEATYVFNLRRHLPYTMNRNYFPLFSQYENAAKWADPMQLYLQSPTVSGYPSIANNGMGLLNSRFIYQMGGVCPTCVPGYDQIVTEAFEESANYHSLQVNVRRNMTKHLSFGASFTWGKYMSLGSANLFNSDPGVGRSNEFPNKYRNWGPTYSPSPQYATFNFVYEAPNLGQKLNFKPLGFLTDHWMVSGLGQWRSNAMTGVPGFGFSNTSGSCTNPANPPAGTWSNCYPQWNWTGSSEGARVNVVGDYRLSSIGKTWSYDPAYPTDTKQAITVPGASPAVSPTLAYDAFSTGDNWATNPDAWGTPMPCSKAPGISPFTGQPDPHYGVGENMSCFGNAGPGQLVNVPGTRVNNWDLTLTKDFPLKSERRRLTFRMEMYNVMNHPNFTVGNGAANRTYDWRNWLQGRLINTNVGMNRLGSPMNPRQMSMTLRLTF